jgi:hypothetical protein
VVTPKLWFRLPGQDNPINERFVLGFRLKHSIEEPIPFGEFTFNDDTGHGLSEFNLTYGSTVFWSVVDEGIADGSNEDFLKKDPSRQSDPHTFEGYNPEAYVRGHDLCVIGVVADSSGDVRTIQGGLTVFMAHPWFIFRDVDNHAYAPMRVDELIKKVIEEGKRGWPLTKIIASNFDKTDDEGRIPRYKCQTTCLEFIQENLLPVTSIGFDHPYFYCDLWGDFHLKSFTNMISEPPKMLFGPKISDIQDQKTIDRLSKCVEDNGISNDGRVEVRERTVTIFDPVTKTEFQQELRPSFVVEDPNLHKQFALGQRDPGTKMPGDSGSYFPIMNYFRDMIRGTSVKIGKNRLLGDSISSVFHDSNVLNKCFSMEVTSSFTGQFGQPGMTAYVFIPKVSYQSTDDKGNMKVVEADHWAEGKWLIYATEHFIQKGDSIVYTKTTLVRPTLVIRDEETSSVATASGMWRII